MNKSLLGVKWSARTGRALLAYALILFSYGLVSSRLFREIIVGPMTHTEADWLVNYSGGFVRRGLIGSILMAATPNGSTAVWVIAGLLLVLYAVLWAYCIGYLKRADFSWSAIVLACAPMGLAGVGWDGAFKKEALALLAIALLGWARRSTRPRARVPLQAAAVLVFTVAIFSWEPSVFAIPVLLYLLRPTSGFEPVPQARVFSILVLGLGIIGGAASFLFRGSPEVVSAIQASIVDHGLDPGLAQTDAVVFLNYPVTAVFAEIAARYPNYFFVLLLLPLGLLPIFLTPWFRRNWIWVAATAVLVVPLYAIGLDYGRWHGLLYLAPALAIMAEPAGEGLVKFWKAWTAIPYLTLWSVPFYLAADEPFKWDGAVPSALWVGGHVLEFVGLIPPS